MPLNCYICAIICQGKKNSDRVMGGKVVILVRIILSRTHSHLSTCSLFTPSLFAESPVLM